MCGIFAYKGDKNAIPLLLHGLEKLEYRGYDSAGIFALDTVAGKQLYCRSVGKVADLARTVDNWDYKDLHATIGMAHTRWATHGGVTMFNTHPHHDAQARYYIAHNGIIENYHKLKQGLIAEWYEFYSQTDTEVIAALLGKYASDNFLQTVQKVLGMLVWAYGLIIIDTQHPDELIGFRWGSPLVFAKKHHKDGQNEFFFASDTQSLSGLADEFSYLEDGELVRIHGNDYSIITETQVINKSFEVLQLADQDTGKGGFEHFMLKEIFEQPAVMRRIMKGRVNFETGVLDADALDYLKMLQLEKIIIIWCGTSYHAWLLGSKWINMRTGIDVSVKIASEVLYEEIAINDKTLFVFVSQSGETADSMEVLKYLKEKWAKTLGIVNVVGSSISRLTDAGMFTRCGFEIGVASTKAFTGQAICLLIIALWLWQKHNLKHHDYKTILRALEQLPNQIDLMLQHTKEIQELAKKVSEFENMFFLGRSLHAPIAAEWSLKMKEISYIHSEAYAAGELKHGSLALITNKFLSIILAPEDSLFEQNLSTINEVKARNGVVFAVGTQEVEKADASLLIPKTHEALYPILETIVLQLLSYYTAKTLWREIDKPRNLAKSVTVK